MCEKLLANPLIEDYEIVDGRRGVVKFGVLRFPGSCDEVDAQLACERVGEAVILWHGDRDLQGVDAVVVPGGFSYGDYLRVGAIARFAPMMESVDRVRARGRARARHLQRLPGAVRGGPAAGRAAAERVAALRLPPGRPRGRARRHAVHARVRARASGCRSRSSTRPAAGTRRRSCTTRSRRTARWCCATRRARTPTARSRDIAGVPQRGRQRVRPDAAPRARRRPADRLDRRAEAVRVDRATHVAARVARAERRRVAAAPRARPHRRRVRADRRASSAASRTTSSWRCSR